MDMKPWSRYMACWPRPMNPRWILSEAALRADLAAGAAGVAPRSMPAGTMRPAAPIADAFRKSLLSMFQCYGFVLLR